jgi:hypothetical protein
MGGLGKDRTNVIISVALMPPVVPPPNSHRRRHMCTHKACS